MSNKTETRIRAQIFRQIKALHAARRNVPFVPGVSPVPYAGRIYDEKDLISLVDASLDFWLTAGRFAARFEKEFAAFLGVRHCLLTNSGSSANLLAISALTSPTLGRRRLRPGDEVITTACGFPTTLNPIVQNGLVPVFVDVQLGTYNPRPRDIAKALSRRTKAVFLAHTLGNPFDLGPIRAIARAHGLWLIEDNSDALGSRYRGAYTGTRGDISTASFYPAHHITMGEGGAVMTNDLQLNTILMSFRDWGRDCSCQPGSDNRCGKRFSQQFGDLPFGYDHKYVYSHIGYNLKVTDMQAAIGVTQLKKLPAFIRKRRENFTRLYAAFSPYGRYLVLPQATSGTQPSWFGFPVLVRSEAPFTRDDIVRYLEQRKIATRMLFGGNLTKQPAYAKITRRIAGTLVNTDLVMNNLFWIGVYPGITGAHLRYITSVVRGFMKEYA